MPLSHELLPDREQEPAGGGREGYSQELLEFPDRTGCARTAGDDVPLWSGVHTSLDLLLRFAKKVRHRASGCVILRVRVRVAPFDPHEIALHEAEIAPRGGVVAVYEGPLAEGGREGGVSPNDLLGRKSKSRRDRSVISCVGALRVDRGRVPSLYLESG